MTPTAMVTYAVVVSLLLGFGWGWLCCWAWLKEREQRLRRREALERDAWRVAATERGSDLL